MAEGSLTHEHAERPHHDRHRVLVHLEIGAERDPMAHLHLGPRLPDSLRRYLGCDASVRVVFERLGVPYATGATRRTVPDRMRRHLEHRDGGCRAPGCNATMGLQVHHIEHWEDGGATTTANLLCLCARHHRLHHLGRLAISGNADHPATLEFRNHHGLRLAAVGTPRPPEAPPPQAARDVGITHAPYRHGSGEQLDRTQVWF